VTTNGKFPSEYGYYPGDCPTYVIDPSITATEAESASVAMFVGDESGDSYCDVEPDFDDYYPSWAFRRRIVVVVP
jgi:hypothetical protein